MKRRALALALLAAVVLMAVPASANHIRGMRIVQTGLDPNTLTIDVDVFGYAVDSYLYSTLFVGGNTGYGAAVLPAIDWGDGSTVPFAGYGPVTGIPIIATATSVGGQSVNVYRGSFSHVYAAPGDYTIRTSSVFNSGNPPLITGSAYVYTSVIGTVTFTYTFVTNTLQAMVGAMPSPLEVPTLGFTSLMALALLLAGCATWVLRRA